ncbi:MAG: hypothetical protein M4579_001291 [Chaenotheca gracillima]|nr:MAG: hypothetical protein M4579_001291 [Chaenotheca gracillima]
MEDQVLHLLAETQSANEGPRKQGETSLRDLYTHEAFPVSLCSIASHTSVPPGLRQSALLILRTFVLTGWSSSLDGFKGTVLVNDSVKTQLRDVLLQIATSSDDDRKVKSTASYVVSKIASADFPDHWPTLLPTLLHTIPSGNASQVHGALKVLSDLVDDSLSDEQFFHVARDLIKVVYDVAVEESRKTILRALGEIYIAKRDIFTQANLLLAAVSVFRSCFDILETVMEVHKAAVKGFVDEALSAWFPFFIDVIRKPLPETPKEDEESTGAYEEWRGLVALKIQSFKTLMRIRQIFPGLLSPQSPALFSATWQELISLQQPYHALYIDDEREGRLVDADELPYSLDFLVLEELDFLQACLRAPPVRKELEAQLRSQSTPPGSDANSWLTQLMQLSVAFAQITKEEEGLWDLDVNIYLSEETSVTANYTPRTACGDLLIKLGEWLNTMTAEGLMNYSKNIYDTSQSWKPKEAALYVLNQLLSDYFDVHRSLSSEVANGFGNFVRFALEQEEVFLRARGHLAAGSLVKTSDHALDHMASSFLDLSLKSIREDPSAVVKAAAIRALQDYLQSLPEASMKPLQVPIISALSDFYAAQDPEDLAESDDLMVTLVETLRDALWLDTSICIAPGSGALDLLFTLASKAANNFQLTMLVNEGFQDIASHVAELGNDAYIQLCEKVLPSLTGAFDVGALTEENALTNLAAELLSILAEHGLEPLPQGFVGAVMPKLHRLLMTSTDGELIRPATEAVKYILVHDHKQLFEWHDGSGKYGLEVCLMIIDRLLQPQMDDYAAAEVGGLAAELVEKAGHERLGPYLVQLLQAVANRLATARQASLIQSLILVFARLSLVSAKDVVDFLASVQIGDSNGLQLVMSTWLENSVHFAGYDEIRQNAIALSKLYELNDQRLTQTMVKGDLIVPESDLIMTRSKAKKNPDQFTLIPFPLKVIKILIDELSSASGLQRGFPSTASPGMFPGAAGDNDNADDFDDGDDDDGEDWEDLDDSTGLDLGSTTMKKALMAWADAESGPGAGKERVPDDETQAFLVSFFKDVAQRGTGGFQGWYDALSAEEKSKLERGVAE